MAGRLSLVGRVGARETLVRAALSAGWTLEAGHPGAVAGDAAILIDPTAAELCQTLAAAGDKPVLLLRDSAIPDRADLDWLTPPAGVTTRRVRAAPMARALDDAEILAEAGPLSWATGTGRAEPGEICVACEAIAAGGERQALAEALGPEMLAAAETAAASRGWSLRAVPLADLPGQAHGAAVVLPGHSTALWRVLASGAEVILAGRLADPPDTCHAATDAAGLARAILDIADGVQRNDRDGVMTALAAESLFLALPVSGPALEEALREELAHLARQRPRVTIVVNCYNYREYVRDAVLSACDQTDPADQILVVDDGSTDGSMETLADVGGITILRKENGGQASAFNHAVARVEGDLVLFLDADGRLLPHALERLRQTWRPGLSRMQFALETVDAQGLATGLYPDAAGMLSGDVTGRIAGWGNYPFMPTSGNIFALPALRAVMPIPEEPWRLCADHYLNVLTAYEGEIASIPEVLGQYRVHGRNGHFHPFGNLAFRELHHLKYRVRVWRDLLAHLARRDRPGDGLRRLQVHRRLLAAAADARTAGFVPWPRESLAALRLATASATGVAGGATWRRAAEHLGYAVLAGLRRLWPSRDDGPATAASTWPWPRDDRAEARLASASTWPVLDHGALVDATSVAGARSWPGWGWRVGARGEPLEGGRVAQLAFRLPWHPAHWLVRLELARPLPGRLIVDLNGRRLIDRGAPGASCDIFIPAEMLAPAGPHRLCDLRLRTPGKIPLRVASLKVLAVPRGPDAAPLAARDRWLDVTSPAHGAFALGRGWTWPAAGEVRAEGLQARLHLALPPDLARCMLRLRLTQPSACIPVVFVDGTRCPVFVSEDGATLTAVWQRRRVVRDRAIVDLVAPRGERLDLRLRAVRVDPLAPGQAAFDEPREGDPGRSGEDHPGPSVPLPLPGRLVLQPPAADTERRAVLLLVRDGDATSVQSLPMAGDGLRACVMAGLSAAVRVPLVPGRTVAQVVAFGAGREAVRLKSVTFTEAIARQTVPRLSPGDGMAGDTLAAATLHPIDWMDPVEGALWLRGLAGSLAFDMPRDATLRLEIDVLALPGEGLEIACEAVSASVDEPGPRTISLLLPPRGPGRTVIALRSRTLVPLPSPVPTPAMIGGAVMRVAVRAEG